MSPGTDSWWLTVEGGRRRSAAPAGRWSNRLGPRARPLPPTSHLVGRILVLIISVSAAAYLLGVSPSEILSVLGG